MYQRRLCLLALALALVFSTGASAEVVKGKALAEYWFGGAINDNLDNLKASADFPNNPTSGALLDGFEQPDVGAWDYWAGRLTAWLIPPETGAYTFWTASDDDSEVWLSTDDNPANLVKICNVEGWTGFRNYAGTEGAPGANQKSAAINLEAGKRYFIQGLFSDGTGGGHMSVGWAGPGIGDVATPIAGTYIECVPSEVLFLAQNPAPANGELDVVSPLFTWTSMSTAAVDYIYVGTKPELGAADLMMTQPSVVQLYFHMGILEPGVTYYWRVDSTEATGTLHTGKVWSFTVQPLKAHFPSPANGALYRSAATTLAWTAGQNGMSCDVYFGTDKAAVEAGDASVAVASQTADLTFDPNGLKPLTTYYWRVDQYDFMDAKVVGDVWSFSTFDPNGGAVAEYWASRPASGAPNVVTTVGEINFDFGSGTVQGENSPDAAIPVDNFTCRWTAELNVPVTGTYKLYEASDDGARMFLNGVQVASGWVDRGTTEDATAALELVAGERYQVVMEMYENGGGAAAFLRWSGPGIAKEIIPQGALQLPVMAYSPVPGMNAVKVEETTALSWAAGKVAVQYKLFLGTDPNLVAAEDASTFVATLAEATFTPAKELAGETTYFWKVDVVAADGSVIPGLVWSFTVRVPPSPLTDVTMPGDVVQGVPNDGDWPGGELPAYAIDDKSSTKFLHFKGETQPSGIQVTPAIGATIVQGLTFTSANDAAERDPVKFELCGSNDSINGPWTLIAAGDITDFAQATAWPRLSITDKRIAFANDKAYTHYQVLFPALRNAAGANSMQIAEIELLGIPAVLQFADGFEAYAAGSSMQGQNGWKGWAGDAGATGYASSDQAFSGANSVKIVGSSDLVHEFAVKGGKVVFSAMQYIPTGATGTTFFILMNQYNDPGNGLDWSVQTEFKMTEGTVGSLPLVRDKWVEVKCVINLDENTVTRYYDGKAIAAAEQWDDNVHGTLQAIDLFGNGASAVYYDDITVTSY